jgi:DNA-binding LacI/PurR family transcriptional regulator
MEVGYNNWDHLVVNGDWTPASGDLGLRKLLEKEPDIDAVFISNDQMALGALQAARDLNIKVPDHLGMVGFDDIPEAAYFYPPLTTIRQRPNALGEKAVDMIRQLIYAQENGNEVKPQINWIEPELIIRLSSIKRGNDETS